MAVEDMTGGYVYFTNGAVSTGAETITYDNSSTYVVKVSVTGVEQTTGNKVTALPMPVARGQASTKDPESRMINLKRLNEKMIVRGHLKTESGGDNCIVMKNKLRYLMGSAATGYGTFGDTITMVWIDHGVYSEYEGLVTKGLFKEKPSIDKMDVTIQFEAGVLIGGS